MENGHLSSNNSASVVDTGHGSSSFSSLGRIFLFFLVQKISRNNEGEKEEEERSRFDRSLPFFFESNLDNEFHARISSNE